VVEQLSDRGYCGLVASARLSSLLKTGAGDDEQIKISCQAFSGYAIKSNASTENGIPADMPATAESKATKRRVIRFGQRNWTENKSPDKRPRRW